jgi:four helix bundle protein
MLDERKKFDLEDRLIRFAIEIIQLAESLPKSKAANHIAGQLIRCGTSPAPNYGEAQGAESRSDFIHKMKICRKELRESKVWLKIVRKAPLVKKSTPQVDPLIDENDQLISIFVSSIKTAKNNRL